MTQDPNAQLHRQIEGAIAAGDVHRSRALLRQALQDPTAETYQLAAMVALTEEQRESFLRKAEELESSLRRQARGAALASEARPEASKAAMSQPPPTPRTLPRWRKSWAWLILLAVLGLVPVCLWLAEEIGLAR